MYTKIIEALIHCKPCDTGNTGTFIYGKPAGRFAGSKKKRKGLKWGK